MLLGSNLKSLYNQIYIGKLILKIELDIISRDESTCLPAIIASDKNHCDHFDIE